MPEGRLDCASQEDVCEGKVRRVVLLGESTHGTEEYYATRAEVTKRLVEERGFDSLWTAEHVVLFDDYGSRYPYSPDGKIPAPPASGMLEPLTSLAYLAANTTRLRLGTGILLLPQRNPVYTAKETSTVDVLSGGRLDFGIGGGWKSTAIDHLAEPARRQRTKVEIANAVP